MGRGLGRGRGGGRVVHMIRARVKGRVGLGRVV